MPVVLLALLAILLLLRQSSVGGTMRTSPQGRNAIIQHEGIRYEPYQDVAGYWTVGIGHLIVPGDGVPRVAGVPQPIDETFLMSLFETDLAHAEEAVNRYVTVPLAQNQFDALTDFVFNFGPSRFAQSSLVRLINQGQYSAAAEEFKRWVNAGGVPVAGLIARRDDNYRTFLT